MEDADELLEQMKGKWRKYEAMMRRKQNQSIAFDRSPVALVFVADVHLGNKGVDYDRLFREAEIIANTPGMWLISMGDLLDNFILPKMIHARFDNEVTPIGEWTLVKKYLGVVAPKLIASVNGNHEFWTTALTGIDYFKDVLERVNPDAIYDPDDALITLKVNAAEFPMRIRHLWQGNSIWNPTHGVERAAKFDGDFTIGIGGHTHASGLARQMNVAGKTGMAVLCGSYKAFDPYARQKGFAKPNGSTAVTLILSDDGSIVGVDRLETAARMIKRLR